MIGAQCMACIQRAYADGLASGEKAAEAYEDKSAEDLAFALGTFTAAAHLVAKMLDETQPRPSPNTEPVPSVVLLDLDIA